MNTAYLGLGSNLGDRRWQLAEAVRRLAADPAIAIMRGSSVYETKPVGVTAQPDFLNLVLEIATGHAPRALLAAGLGIEAGLGRERRERWGPRTLDIDLLLIVDLERNDLGRVCRYGSVRVAERHRLETHPTVFHLVATVSGQLRTECDVFDCLRAMFPGGSITGAPKIHAMQLIAELEPCRRHVYTGSLGYLGFDGACDLNIAIRTILCHGGRACYHVGGGIVWDSEPAAEYQETLDKGRALRAALLGGA